MALAIDWLTIDSRDPKKLAEFWVQALDGYKITYDDEEEGEVAIEPDDGRGWRLLFLRVDDERVVKNRLHMDLRPDDQQAEVERLLELGARKIDIGQGDVTWVVMADPEGNEFCVLRAKRPDEA